RENVPVRVKKVTLADSYVAGHSSILTPDAEFSDLFLTELGRGCSRGCRFCAAGFVYRPPRLWSAESIIRALAEKPEDVKRIGLLGMEMARPADLSAIASYLLRESCSLSFSSLRADAIGPELLALLEESGLKTAAIAPDGGSERLRKVINKGLSEEELLWAAELLVRAGVTNLKLYFMIGLPTETWDDLEELVQLTLKIKRKILEVGRSKGRVSTLTLSLNPFVPKAWTPFQFCAFDQVAVLKKKIKFLRKKFSRQANMKLLVDKVENAFFQAMLARGDRTVGAVLHDLVQSGRNWQHVYKEKGADPACHAMRTRDRDEFFCWEVIDIGVKREYLWQEYQKALTGQTTIKCKPEKCKRCGACHGE
ncbi:MAG: radical SAM protein, partial [Thermodesulfobacteriota bacterium]|nr:radical SAM protein [Thermodesulfobacteriota bacterium]